MQELAVASTLPATGFPPFAATPTVSKSAKTKKPKVPKFTTSDDWQSVLLPEPPSQASSSVRSRGRARSPILFAEHEVALSPQPRTPAAQPSTPRAIKPNTTSAVKSQRGRSPSPSSVSVSCTTTTRSSPSKRAKFVMLDTSALFGYSSPVVLTGARQFKWQQFLDKLPEPIFPREDDGEIEVDQRLLSKDMYCVTVGFKTGIYWLKENAELVTAGLDVTIWQGRLQACVVKYEEQLQCGLVRSVQTIQN
jgi:hypothetical protein